MEEWKEYRLEELCKGRGTYGIGASAVPYDKSKYTYLRITDINDDGTINKKGLLSVDSPEACNYVLSKNDIVFARTGNSTGRSYFYDGTDGVLVYAGFLIKFSLDEKKVNPRILKYYTHSNKYYDWVNSFNTGSTRGNINAQTYGNMPILLPPRAIQDKIVSILSSLDDKIELNRRINDNLEQQATALFDKMFPSITNGNCKIGDWLRPKRGIGLLTKDTILGDVPVVAGGLRPAAYHNKANTLSPVVTISASGANAGYVALWNKPVWSSDSSYIDSSLTSDVYFWYVMLKKRQKEIFDAQTGSAQPHIYPQHIAELPIKQLEKEQIIKYTEQATPLFKMVGNLTEENIKLAQLRDTLLPRLMSGELEIS
jgi:type I restriction enzyme S subunit